MARRFGKKRGRARAKSIPMLPIAPLVAVAYTSMQYDGVENKMNMLIQKTTGVNIKDGSFNAARATPFWIAEGVGIIGHKAANKLGVNNYVRRMTFGYLSL